MVPFPCWYRAVPVLCEYLALPGLWGRISAPDMIPPRVLDPPWDTPLLWGEVGMGFFVVANKISDAVQRAVPAPFPRPAPAVRTFPLKRNTTQRSIARLRTPRDSGLCSAYWVGYGTKWWPVGVTNQAGGQPTMVTYGVNTTLGFGSDSSYSGCRCSRQSIHTAPSAWCSRVLCYTKLPSYT